MWPLTVSPLLVSLVSNHWDKCLQSRKVLWKGLPVAPKAPGKDSVCLRRPGKGVSSEMSSGWPWHTESRESSHEECLSNGRGERRDEMK